MGNQTLTMVFVFLGFPHHLSLQVLLFLVVWVIFAVTLMRKVLNFRADPVHPSVIPLAVCLIDICYLPTSVPATLANVFETGKPFPMLAALCSSDSL